MFIKPCAYTTKTVVKMWTTVLCLMLNEIGGGGRDVGWGRWRNCKNLTLTLKMLGDEFDPSPCGFSKNVFFRESMEPCFFVTFNILITHIFPETFIEIPQLVQKIWRFSSSILTIFINFSNFSTFPCCKETSTYNKERQQCFTFNLP